MQLAEKKHRLILAARDTDEAERVAADLRVRFDAQIAVIRYDAADFASLQSFFDECLRIGEGTIHGIVLASGYMSPQAGAQRDPAEARRIIEINYTGAA